MKGIKDLTMYTLFRREKCEGRGKKLEIHSFIFIKPRVRDRGRTYRRRCLPSSLATLGVLHDVLLIKDFRIKLK